MSNSARTPHFVTCAPGLEPLLHAELRALRLAKVERQVGGVYFEGDEGDAMRANLELRSAVRVLRRIARFPAPDSDALYEGAQAIEWERYLAPGATFVAAAHSRNSQLDHTLFVEQRVKDAVVDRLQAARGERPSVDKDAPDLRVDVHLFRDRCTLALDTSGDSLHKRGWRVFQGKAPMSETLAAAIVQLSGWDRRSPLVDPFCGSATLLIEAALLAADHAPGLHRKHFAFESFPGFQAPRWEALKQAARERVRPLPRLRLVGSDISEEIVAGARENCSAAGVLDNIELSVANAAEFAPRRGWNGFVLANPPYGERIGEAQKLMGLYRAFGERLREFCAGYSVAVFSGNSDLAGEMERALGKPFTTRTPLLNGALECELLRADI